MKIQGTLKSGLGEGAYFISLKHYNNEINKKLGFNPFKGTLNVHVEEKKLKDFLENIERSKIMLIEGFEDNGKKFGSVRCIKAKIKDAEGAIIIPDINKHKDIIEFISCYNLREKLKLKEDDVVDIEIIEDFEKFAQ